MTTLTEHEPHGAHQTERRPPVAGSDPRSNTMTSSSMPRRPRWSFRRSSFRQAIPRSQSSRPWRPMASATLRDRSAPSSWALGRYPRPQNRAAGVHVPDGLLNDGSRCATDLSAGRHTCARLLVALRLIQGFAVAGEISGASSMILEHAPFGRRGFFASFSLQGVQAGQIFAAAVFLPMADFMPQAAFNSWGWRVRSCSASL